MLPLALLAVALAQDTVRTALAPVTLDLAGYTAQVLAHHPVVAQARLVESIAGNELLAARGALIDPVASVNWDRKRFGGKESYEYLVAGVKVPTSVGIDVKLGYERTRGTSFNPDRSTPTAGQFVAGVEIPLAQGILTDARRNAVAQARALRDAATGERAAAVNKLLFTAVKEYAGWYEAERRRAIADEGVALAEFRLRATEGRLRSGEAAPIDTVEAALELARRRVTQLEARSAAFAARQDVNANLWGPDGAPFDLAPDAVPSLGTLEAERLDTTLVDAWMARAFTRHPNLVKALAKVRQARANRLLYAQELLPDATLGVSLLGNRDSVDLPFGGWPALGGSQKLSLSAKSGVLLMKERGKFGAGRDKLAFAEWDAALVRRDVELAVRTAVNDVSVFEAILDRQREAVAQARRLRDGESRKFENGESTLFLVNSRDRTLLDEQVKLAAYEAKYAGARAALAIALGEPGLPAR